MTFSKFVANFFISFFAAVVVVGCTTNDDCRQTEACFNRDCVDPCNCGTNAQCFVNNHKPVCFCPEGYTGDPEVGCVKGRTENGMLKRFMNLLLRL